jgi:hypothetical protein
MTWRKGIPKIRGSQRFDIRLLDRHHGNRLAADVEHLQDDPRLTACRVRDPVDEHGHVSCLEVMLIDIAAQGDPLIQFGLHELWILQGFPAFYPPLNLSSNSPVLT